MRRTAASTIPSTLGSDNASTRLMYAMAQVGHVIALGAEPLNPR
jgi:hypothetical protein